MKDRIFEFIIPKLYAVLICICLYSVMINNITYILLSICVVLAQTAIVLLCYIPEIKQSIEDKKNYICPNCHTNMSELYHFTPINYCPRCGIRLRLFRKDVDGLFYKKLIHYFDKTKIQD